MSHSRHNRPEGSDSWVELNGRRLALIRKRYEPGLSEPEEQELAALQAKAAEVVEGIDRRRLAHLRSLVQDADEPGTP